MDQEKENADLRAKVAGFPARMVEALQGADLQIRSLEKAIEGYKEFMRAQHHDLKACVAREAALMEEVKRLRGEGD